MARLEGGYMTLQRCFRLVVAWTVLTILATSASQASNQCGVERRAIKSAFDPAAAKIDASAPTPTSIVQLVQFPAPSPIPDTRIAPSETTFWQLDAMLVEFKHESDGDYHLVLKDQSGRTMIAEIPAPECVKEKTSPFTGAITKARQEFDSHFTVTDRFQEADLPVRIAGIGMFDFDHGQTGLADNGIELHPVLSIDFEPAPGSEPLFSARAVLKPKITSTAPKIPASEITQPRKAMRTPSWRPCLVALLTLLLLYLLLGSLTRRWNPLAFSIGAHGRLSSSKLQFFLWTVVALFAYVALYIARVEDGLSLTGAGFPQNLLLAMGLSVTTMAAAKGITASYVASGKINKAPAATAPGLQGKGVANPPGNTPTAAIHLGDVFLDDDGFPDLTKIQMMSWTLVAIGVYLYNVVSLINTPSGSLQLPDIDTALLVLMGLGQGAYLAKKAM